MIIALASGGQLVLGECHWTPGAYLAAGNQRGSQGVIITPAELDQAIAGLTDIRAAITERDAAAIQPELKRIA